MLANILVELLRLPADDRVRLASALWASLASDDHREFELLPGGELQLPERLDPQTLATAD
jgi:hypothetical protein